jgi:deoxyadenosine/deoxycytidine kinase
VARYIAVEGPIGVGKTALAGLLAEALQARPVLEATPNPFLDFDGRNGFPAAVYSLLARFQQKDALHQDDLFSQGLVADHLFACDRIFAQTNLGRDELLLYDRVWALLTAQVPRPDLVVYLQARPEVLLSRLKRRGGRVPPREWVEKMARAYAEFFFHYGEGPLLVVNTSEIDFVENRPEADDLVAVIQKTRAGVSHYSPLGSRR